MKTLFDAETAADIRRRIQNVTANSARQWGKMTPAQMLAHCSNGMAQALGDEKPSRMLLGYLFGGMVKGKVLSEGPMKRNAPTAPTLRVVDDRDVEREKARLLGLVDRIAAGPQACTDHPHTFFGRLSQQEWGILQYKHLDHHLSQFSA